ncbi:HNH endonuclease [Collinsella ihumii]|uniref:HNH endonuclease n=1 Tax=Collinsella ihumii TaxID=1720204 RepID=A0AAW7JVA7_9ACTN|nr:HNH endonuclease [Collinsella ihumii]MDN0069728.1 HNH endonuclease [Collinsella ihumii]
MVALAESSLRLERAMVISENELSDVGVYLRHAITLCMRQTGGIGQLTEYLVSSLEATASAIEEYIDSDLSIESELLANTDERLRPSDWLATEGAEAASILRTNASSSAMETIRSELTQRAHRHPVSGGRMYDSQHVEINPEEFSNAGIFYWVPDSSRTINGISVKTILNMYNIYEIKYIDGFPVFPEHIIVAEIGLPAPLSENRYRNYAASNAALLSEAVVKNQFCCKSNYFAGMINEYLSEIGVNDNWFQSVGQVRDFIRRYDLTWHEKEDMLTLQLLPRAIHELAPHDGGISYARLRDATARDIELLSNEAARIKASGQRGMS